MEAEKIHSGSTMGEVVDAFPGARRALFRNYHIGGCASCAFKDEETLEELCVRNDGVDADEVLTKIRESHLADEKVLVEPKVVQERLGDGVNVLLVDIRSREEYEAVKIEGAVFLTQDLMQDLMANYGKYDEIVMYDHQGKHSLDAASYLEGHGVTNIKCMRGGIDQWAQEVDGEMPRYELG